MVLFLLRVASMPKEDADTDTANTAPTNTPKKAVPAKPQARLRRRKYGWPIAVVVMLVGSIGAWRYAKSRGEAPIPVQTVKVQRGKVRDFVTSIAAGRVSAKQEATVRAEIAGTVRIIHKHRGDLVAVGEPLLTYDASDLKERLRLAQAAIGITQAQVKQAQESAGVVETNLARARKLKESGSIPSAEVENLEGQSSVALRAVESARAGVGQAMANAQLAVSAVGKTVVRAPFGGRVIDVKTEVGESTVPGAPLVLLADTSVLHVDAEIDEADLARVRVGMPADVSLDALPGERVRGKVSSMAPSVGRDLRGGRSVAIDVELVPEPRLLVGMSADVDVIVDVRENSLFIPPNAVIGRGADRSVYLVQGGIAKKRSIDIGISTWESIEVKGGLAQGDEVISTLAAAKLVDGSRVVTSPAPADK